MSAGREVALPLGLVDVEVAPIDEDVVGARARLAASAGPIDRDG